MKNAATSRTPITAYVIAPHAPEPVGTVYATFNRVTDEWAETVGEIDDAREAANVANAAATRAVVDHAKNGSGKAPADPAVVAAEHAATIATLTAKRDALLVAVDEVGNELAASIAANRDDWVATLEREREDAAARFDKAIQDAKAALRAFAPMRRAVQWVSEFEVGPATVGLVTQYTGGSVSVRASEFVRGPHAEPQDPAKLLDLVATATAPPEVPQSRTHRTAARFPVAAS